MGSGEMNWVCLGFIELTGVRYAYAAVGFGPMRALETL